MFNRGYDGIVARGLTVVYTCVFRMLVRASAGGCVILYQGFCADKARRVFKRPAGTVLLYFAQDLVAHRFEPAQVASDKRLRLSLSGVQYYHVHG